MTNLPSRERAAELAADERVYVTDMGSIPPNAPQHVRDAVMADAAWAADKFAILSAYAAGRLVPVERVSEMRERAAWRPIETAPRDGTPILVAIAGDEFRPMLVQSPRAKSRWHVVGSESRVLTKEPTHWRPLPAPPDGGGDV